jgi:hypothetical protein
MCLHVQLSQYKTQVLLSYSLMVSNEWISWQRVFWFWASDSRCLLCIYIESALRWLWSMVAYSMYGSIKHMTTWRIHQCHGTVQTATDQITQSFIFNRLKIYYESSKSFYSLWLWFVAYSPGWQQWIISQQQKFPIAKQ